MCCFHGEETTTSHHEYAFPLFHSEYASWRKAFLNQKEELKNGDGQRKRSNDDSGQRSGPMRSGPSLL